MEVRARTGCARLHLSRPYCLSPPSSGQREHTAAAVVVKPTSSLVAAASARPRERRPGAPRWHPLPSGCFYFGGSPPVVISAAARVPRPRSRSLRVGDVGHVRARALQRRSATHRSATSFGSAPFFPFTVDRAKRAGGRGTRVRLERSIARCRPLASGRPHRRSSGGGIGGMA